MKNPRPPHPSKRTQSPNEDEQLWEVATSTLDPLKRRKERVHTGIGSALEKSLRQEPRSKIVVPEAKSDSQRSEQQARTPAARKTEPPLADYDAKKARRIGSGRVSIERRIDLHGMRQGEAHAALRRFLLACHAAGLRDVLVITGKGGPIRQKDESEPRHWTDREERGVLKRSVPQWLAEPELRAIVVSYTTASIRHGGEGALYIHLRRRDRV